MANKNFPVFPPGGGGYTKPAQSDSSGPSGGSASSGSASSGSNKTFIEFAIAGAIVVASVAIAERVSKGAAWGLVALIFMGALVSHPDLLNTLTKLAGGG